MGDTGSYVYLAARSVTAGDLRDVVGLHGAETRVVRSGDLAAVVSTVDLDEFGEEALKRNLEDLSWLEQVARTHDHVINQLNEITTVAPLRMATILFDDDRVAQLLQEWSHDLTSTLDRVSGCSEWSVKAFQDPDTPSAAERTDDQPESGTAYLRRRRSETDRRSASAESAAELADELHRALAARSAASRRLPPQDRRLTGHVGEMTLNGAYLVEQDRGGEFEEVAKNLLDRHAGLRLQVNGPWPPYSFATLEPGGNA